MLSKNMYLTILLKLGLVGIWLKFSWVDPEGYQSMVKEVIRVFWQSDFFDFFYLGFWNIYELSMLTIYIDFHYSGWTLLMEQTKKSFIVSQTYFLNASFLMYKFNTQLHSARITRMYWCSRKYNWPCVVFWIS